MSILNSKRKQRARPHLNPIAGPLLGEFLLGMTVAMAGLWLAAQTSDAEAGAFGLSQQVLESLLVVFRILAIGLSVVITQALGGGHNEGARSTALAALAAASWSGIAVVALVLLGSGGVLHLLNAPASVAPLAQPYLMALAPALLLEAYNLSMAAILRAHLHVRDSLNVMVTMHATHLLLAAVLMRGVGGWDGLGLYGYALAMFLSRVVGLVMHLSLWRRRMELVPVARDWWVLTPKLLAPVFRIGVPGAALEALYRVCFMVSLATTASLGVEALATHSYTYQVLRYVLLVSMSIGWACEIMVGRLVGAGDLQAANMLVRKGVRNGLLASGGLALAVALSAPWLMRAFTRDPAVIDAAQTLLWLSILLETGRVFNLVVTGALRATGDAIYPAAAGAGSMVLALGVGSYVLGHWIGLPGIWIAYALDEWIRGQLMLSRWRWRGWLPHARDTQRRIRRPR